ncbi:MAG: hypothetical protein HY909_15835 [Deltaproteobacteria bacterium]|nr:hypothetical protein [Deltaproteobacteria bacterium]
MTPTASITLRRAPLGEILTSLPAEPCRLLLHLAHRACPRTGRVWTTPLRAADDLGVPVTLVDRLLASLVSEGHLTVWTRGVGALRCYDLGAFFVRVPEVPENLPVGPDDP